MQKYSCGYTRFTDKVITVQHLVLNNISYDINDLASSRLDISRTWLPLTENQVKLEYALDESLMQQTVPINKGDEFYVQLVATCRSTKYQFSSEPSKLKTSGSVVLEIPAFVLANSFKITFYCFIKIKNGDIERIKNSAMRNYSILYQREINVLLSGDEAQISVFSADFSERYYKDALWNINFDLPNELEYWPSLELSNVLTIMVNKNIPIDIINEKNNLTLLVTDIVFLTFSKFFENEDSYEMLLSEEAAGSWVVFARNYFRLVFKEEYSPRQLWDRDKEIVLRNCQSVSSQLLSRAHGKLAESLK